MKLAYALLVFAIFLPLSVVPIGFAQTNQVTSSVSLQYLNIQVSYPSQALPGDNVALHVQANAKSNIDLLSLTAKVYYADGTNLRQLQTATLASNSHLANENTVSNDVQVTIPQDAPRTSLIAVFSENVQVAHYDYSYYYPYVLLQLSQLLIFMLLLLLRLLLHGLLSPILRVSLRLQQHDR